MQTAVLDAIADGLADLADLMVRPAGQQTDAAIHIKLAEVEGHLSGLVTSVRQFNGHLQRLLREDATEDAVLAVSRSHLRPRPGRWSRGSSAARRSGRDSSIPELYWSGARETRRPTSRR